MPDINKMRNNLYSSYPGDLWKRKVNAMPDDQVIAIWHRMNTKGEFENGKQKQVVTDPEAIQLSLFDI